MQNTPTVCASHLPRNLRTFKKPGTSVLANKKSPCGNAPQRRTGSVIIYKFIYIYIYQYIYIYTGIYIHIYVYIYIYPYIHIFIYIYPYIHISIYIYIEEA
jgi:hypothetical protein